MAPKVLIVEDNAINRQYLSGILCGWGIEHDMAPHGREAMELLVDHTYDLILLDIRMPIMDGYEMTKLLRNSESNPNREVPILALTASTLVDERERVLAIGMDDYMAKPFTPEQLKEMMSRYITLGEKERRVSNVDKFHFSETLDCKYLEEFYQGDIERAGVMFSIFLQVIDTEIDRLMELYESEEWSAFAKQAHKIKPNLAMVGLTELSHQLRIYEAAPYDESVRQKIKREIQNLSEKLENGRKIVENELQFISQFQHSS